jgi:hypothetical protein
MTSRCTIRFATAFFVLLVIGVTSTGASAVGEVPGEGVSSALNGTPLLDAYPGAYAAYSLRRLRADYDGPAIRVRRSSDGAEQDVGFTAEGDLDVAAVEAWLGADDGYVVRWYSQVNTAPDMVQVEPANQPLIASSGTVETNSAGKIGIRFEPSRVTHLDIEDALPTGYNLDNMLAIIVGEQTSTERQHIVDFAAPGQRATNTLSLLYNGSPRVRGGVTDKIAYPSLQRTHAAWMINTDGTTLRAFNRHESIASEPITASLSLRHLRLGAATKGGPYPFEGFFSEVVVFDGQTTDGVLDRYDNINAYWDVGPKGYNRGAILPQEYDWQVDFYNWLEATTVDEVTLTPQAFSWDGAYDSVDELADLYMQLSSASASRVVRSEPEWYVLDAGNGKGIEATGEVRIQHQPESGHGNPPRSWSNEPAYLYQLSIPNGDGTEGNPYKGDPALGRRALVVMMVDMMMYASAKNAYARWGDMYGKALLGWAETYRWTKDLLSSEMRASVEVAFDRFLNMMLNGPHSPRAVNTNMDMFAIQAVADIYMASSDPQIKTKAIAAAKDWLFGYPDGELGTKHDVFAIGDRTGGVFDPSGFIMEGDQPDIFYMGESVYHLAGALSAVMDRETGEIPPEWAWLDEVNRRIQEWLTYQYFYDPGTYKGAASAPEAERYITSGAAFTGRTGAGVPKAQAGFDWKHVTVADRYNVAAHIIRKGRSGRDGWLPSEWDMENTINSRVSSLTSKMSSTWPDTPKTWTGWSPWTKPTTYLPQKGWYSRLKTLIDTDDPLSYAPVERSGTYYNKAFGGHPVGDQYWAYKNSDGTREWGFFAEAQARQGRYGGWYGGKIETFWTESTGIVIMNRHGKGGCDDQFEDAGCWDNLDVKAGHHVWGRGENGGGFSTLRIKGRELQRSSTFDLSASTPSVTVNNLFNDPGNPGKAQETGSEIQGQFEVQNTIEALSNGVRVTHSLTSDQTDAVTALWATVPVYMRHYHPKPQGDDFQRGLDDTTIEYWDGAAWQPMPEDQDGDGVPELVGTTALRLGRDYQLGDGPQYVYLALEAAQSVRLSEHIYYDPYQTNQGFRSVHIDLHGNPGTTQTLPASKTLQYTIQTTDPTSGNAAEFQSINLRAGWNLVSTSVEPESADMESIFSGLTSKIELVRAQDSSLYVPADGTNEIGSWDTQESYAIFATSPATLSISGSNIDPARPISLKMGWNALPYTLREPLPVDEALASISGNVVVVKDQDGKVYMPSIGIDNIGVMEPGRGYLVYVDQDITLSYPD